jgi:hypothetical protein
MDARARVAVGVATGYLLGRTRKLRLALTVGGLLAGRRLGTGGVLGKGLDAVTSSPEFSRLRKQVTGAGRAAAVSAAANSLSRVSERIESGGAARHRPDTGQRRPARRKPAGGKSPARRSSAGGKPPARRSSATGTGAGSRERRGADHG